MTEHRASGHDATYTQTYIWPIAYLSNGKKNSNAHVNPAQWHQKNNSHTNHTHTHSDRPRWKQMNLLSKGYQTVLMFFFFELYLSLSFCCIAKNADDLQNYCMTNTCKLNPLISTDCSNLKSPLSDGIWTNRIAPILSRTSQQSMKWLNSFDIYLLMLINNTKLTKNYIGIIRSVRLIRNQSRRTTQIWMSMEFAIAA